LARFDGTAWSEERGWTAYPPPGRLSVDSVQAIARDGALWLHTSEGFARFDPGAVSADRWTTYNADNGLVCDGDCGEAIALAPDGAIWFGTTHFQPAQIGGVQ
jgi:hypothetical protein